MSKNPKLSKLKHKADEDGYCWDRITIGTKPIAYQPGVLVIASVSPPHSPKSDIGSHLIRRTEDFITEQAPTKEHVWCSSGHWGKRATFGTVKGKRDYYCRTCRAEQQARWRATRRVNENA